MAEEAKPTGPTGSFSKLSAGKRWFFYLTGFFSGMSVMALELGAQRMLSPYFSSSQVIWTIVIAFIMVAMAIGNLIGGKLADKYTSPTFLFILLFAAATWVMLIPFVGKALIAAIALGFASFVTNGYLIITSIVCCVVIYIFPLLVLGMITPTIVKNATRDLAESGKIVGRVEAFNTIGSIIGTVIPTFVTIPFIGTSATFIVFASILYAIAAFYFISHSILKIKHIVIAVIALGVGISSTFIGTAFWDTSVLYEGESEYNYLRVEENDSEIILSTNVLFGVQSIKKKQKGLTNMYYDYAMAAPIMSGVLDRPLSMCILGLGTGTFPSQCYDFFGNQIAEVDGVEIDGKIVQLSRKYFSLPEQINVFVEDGRAFLNTTSKKYDIIMVDAYRDITIPYQMSSVEFFTLVKDHLNPNGTMVLNLNMYSTDKASIGDYIASTVAHVFPQTYLAPLSDIDESGNVVDVGSNCELYAMNGANPLEKLSEHVDDIEDVSLWNMMKRVEDRLTKVEDKGYLLTDDKSKIDLLGMDVMDQTIAAYLTYYRKRMEGMNLIEMIQFILG